MVNPVQVSGVTKVEAIPSLENSSIIDRMKASVDSSSRLRAAIAYLTISDDFISNHLVNKLSTDDSYLCVDFHRPTDVGALCSMKSSGANIYLHLLRLAPKALPHTAGMPPHLMHTKMILFDMPDGTSELWVGSHNWTPRALEGINVEYSVILSLIINSPLYLDAERYLENTRTNLCQPVDPNLESFYRALQGEDEDSVVTMELEGDHASTLDHQRITIFGTDPDELNQVNRIGRRVYLVVTDSMTSQQFIYQSSILQTGLLTAADSAADGISFSTRRYASRRGKRYPRLEIAGTPSSTTVDAAYYFITVLLQSKANIQLVDPIKKTFWEPSMDPKFTERLDEKYRHLKWNKPIFQSPSNTHNPETKARPNLELLEEKRGSTNFPLLRKKVVRPVSNIKS